MVGYEIRQPADPAQHQEGHAGRRRARSSPRIATSSASRFTAPSSSACPARPRRRSRRPSSFAKEINPHTIQISLAAPYPGTFLYKQAKENGWFDTNNADLVDDNGIQIAPLHYPHLSHSEIFNSVEDFYKAFYFRAPKIAAIVNEMVRSPQMMKRRLREGVEFFHFLKERARGGALGAAIVARPLHVARLR